MKLNGWQRIGIIASIVWAIGGTAYKFDADTAFLADAIERQPEDNDPWAALGPLATPQPEEGKERAFSDTIPFPPGCLFQAGIAMSVKSKTECVRELRTGSYIWLWVKYQWQNVAVIWFEPLIVWLGVYIVLGLVFWVRRGFAKKDAY